MGVHLLDPRGIKVRWQLRDDPGRKQRNFGDVVREGGMILTNTIAERSKIAWLHAEVDAQALMEQISQPWELPIFAR